MVDCIILATKLSLMLSFYHVGDLHTLTNTRSHTRLHTAFTHLPTFHLYTFFHLSLWPIPFYWLYIWYYWFIENAWLQIREYKQFDYEYEKEMMMMKKRKELQLHHNSITIVYQLQLTCSFNWMAHTSNHIQHKLYTQCFSPMNLYEMWRISNETNWNRLKYIIGIRILKC